jgi:hypothetical protein
MVRAFDQVGLAGSHLRGDRSTEVGFVNISYKLGSLLCCLAYNGLRFRNLASAEGAAHVIRDLLNDFWLLSGRGANQLS